VKKAMAKVAIREAKWDEAGFVTRMIRKMVEEMVSYGGYAPAVDSTAWEQMIAAVADELKGNTVKYLIAESVDGDGLGVAGAELITLGGAFATKKTLHLSVVYVLPQFRRGGIGGGLIAEIVDWGHASGAEQCSLNVLSGNPAMSLYERHGFSVFEVKMVRSLSRRSLPKTRSNEETLHPSENQKGVRE
jgi:GNAT superfamily N-acetyltransferase